MFFKAKNLRGWGGWLVLALSLGACGDKEPCPNHFRLGPERFCIKQCLPDASDVCMDGYTCDADGTRCIEAPPQEPPEDASSAETSPEISPDAPDHEAPSPAEPSPDSLPDAPDHE